MNLKNGDLQSKEKDSPKTPGGISKSHLTSIKRLGLSRKWKKSGISPFVSPLASNSNTTPVDNAIEETKSRKRKLSIDDENKELSPVDDVTNDNSQISLTPPASKEIACINDSTPIRKALVTRKRCRALPYKHSRKDAESAVTVKTSQEDLKTIKEQGLYDLHISANKKDLEEKQTSNHISPQLSFVHIANEMRTEDKPTENATIIEVGDTKFREICNINDNRTEVNCELPNKLVKECIVVIQNKILKKKKENKTVASAAGILHDSKDDVPLSNINSIRATQQNDKSENDFNNLESKNLPKVQPLKKNKSTSSKTSVSSKKQNKHREKYVKENEDYNGSSQSSNSINDDDDDDFKIQKTIYLPKCHEKLCEPVKAKSTGSITQKDIDELKARIEMKKQLLFAKAQSKETEEVRGLIKKWRKGCQDALMELLELMKKKFSDRSDMNYANILQMLKIPPSYVGYDPENDSFSTPDDNSTLAEIFSDL